MTRARRSISLTGLVLAVGVSPLSPAPDLRADGAGLPCADSSEAVTAEREAYVMGTRLHLSVEAREARVAEDAAEAALRELEHHDALLSTWSPGSEMGRLNRTPPGRRVKGPPALALLLAEAETWARATDRAFDPAVGALIDAWALRTGGRRPDLAALRGARSASGPSGVTVDVGDGSVVRFSPVAWIDTGGFGKGAALRQAIRVLETRSVSRAIIDLGGQLAFLGDPTRPLPLAVAHPERRGEPVAYLMLPTGMSAATSGASERWIEVDKRRMGHILDPRSGTPAPAWGSVTVLSPDPLVADILSTALYVMGPEEGLRWAEARGDVAALFLEPDGEGVHATWTRAIGPWLRGSGPGPGDPAVPRSPTPSSRLGSKHPRP